MPEILRIILLATIAGFGSSVLGGTLVLCIGRPGKKFIGLSFSFAAAVLITLVFVDFIPHAIGRGYECCHRHSGVGIWLTMLGIAVGAGLTLLLSLFDKYEHEHIHGLLPHNEYCKHTGLLMSEKRRLLAVALPVAFAIILHDLPKGLAIGSARSVFTAVAIGLSCIPEGMSIAIPLKAGGMKQWKILGVCAVAGFATVLGAVIGFMLGGINPYVSGMMFAIAAGCILGVVFSEIIPIATEYSGRTKLNLPVMIAGALIVILLNYFFHDLTH